RHGPCHPGGRPFWRGAVDRGPGGAAAACPVSDKSAHRGVRQDQWSRRGRERPPNPYVLPGAGLQRGIGMRVEGGVTPLQAISAATKVAAEFLGQEAQLGTLEVGKLADMVILGGDPLADIRQIRQVEVVLRDGLTVWKQ